MKLFLRIALLALLIASALQATRAGEKANGGLSTSFSFSPRVSLESIRQQGHVRLAVIEGSLSYFYYQGNPSGFEYDLLNRYANDLDVSLIPTIVRSAAEAALLLASRRADVAVLPAEIERIEGTVRVRSYLRSGLRGSESEPSLPETGALFVRDDSKELVASLNDYLTRSARDGTVKILFERYFVDNRRFGVTTAGGENVPGAAGTCPFAPLIVKHAATAGFDWRLVAALISEESTFDAEAVSPKGATGLMQLMPETAREVGQQDFSGPEANIRAGVQYLKRLWTTFAEAREEARIAIVLAAYLVGPGHVFDAQRIARDLGLDPNRWTGGVEDVLPLLEDPDFFKETRFGYAQGKHAVEYVNRVLDRFDLYKRDLPPESPATASADRSGAPA